MHKICKLCSDKNKFETWVEKSKFTKDNSQKDGLRSSCAKHYTYQAKEEAKNEAKERRNNSKHPYDITWAHDLCNQYLKMRWKNVSN